MPPAPGCLLACIAGIFASYFRRFSLVALSAARWLFSLFSCHAAELPPACRLPFSMKRFSAACRFSSRHRVSSIFRLRHTLTLRCLAAASRFTPLRCFHADVCFSYFDFRLLRHYSLSLAVSFADATGYFLPLSWAHIFGFAIFRHCRLLLPQAAIACCQLLLHTLFSRQPAASCFRQPRFSLADFISLMLLLRAMPLMPYSFFGCLPEPPTAFVSPAFMPILHVFSSFYWFFIIQFRPHAGYGYFLFITVFHCHCFSVTGFHCFIFFARCRFRLPHDICCFRRHCWLQLASFLPPPFLLHAFDFLFIFHWLLLHWLLLVFFDAALLRRVYFRLSLFSLHSLIFRLLIFSFHSAGHCCCCHAAAASLYFFFATLASCFRIFS